MLHPGLHIQDLLTKKGWSQDQLSDILGKPKSKLSAIITGKANITTDWAVALESVFGGDCNEENIKYSAMRRLEIQNIYDLEKGKDKNILNDRLIKLKTSFPIRELTSRGRLEKGLKKLDDFENQLKKILGINNDGDIYQILGQIAKYKKTEGVPYNENSIKLRLRLAKVEANKKSLGVYNKNKLQEFLSELPGLTSKGKEGVVYLDKKLAEFGVGFVMLKHFEKTRVDGATFWDNETNHPIVVLSIRYDRLNNFWFTLAHELGHVILHENILKDQGYITEDGSDGTFKGQKHEKEANEFASDLLIKADIWKGLRSGPLTTLKISNASKMAGVHPAIVVGRLQHEGILDYYQLARVANEKIEIPVNMRLK